MRNICQTSVPIVSEGGVATGFRACGELAFETVVVGKKECRFCHKHAEEARRFVVDMGGQTPIAEIQQMNAST